MELIYAQLAYTISNELVHNLAKPHIRLNQH
jgi:hypothetical protein